MKKKTLVVLVVVKPAAAEPQPWWRPALLSVALNVIKSLVGL
jgi:hypothetical protein